MSGSVYDLEDHMLEAESFRPNSIYDKILLSQEAQAKNRVDHALAGSLLGGHKSQCCPLVVDTMALFTLLAFIAAGTALLNMTITMSLGGGGGGGDVALGKTTNRQRSKGHWPWQAWSDLFHYGRDTFDVCLEVHLW